MGAFGFGYGTTTPPPTADPGPAEEEQTLTWPDSTVTIRNGTVFTDTNSKGYSVSMGPLVGVSKAGDRLTFVHQGTGEVVVELDPLGAGWHLDDEDGSTYLVFSDPGNTLTIRFDGADLWRVLANSGVDLQTSVGHPLG